ncbi:MAG: TIR domain-containing protein [Leptolyngbya sp. RL_3_1]|nr:TIR domain-containing protein [Leptolyngbya sp. RL_3_1]
MLKSVESDRGRLYRVNLASKSGRQMPKDIWKVLDSGSQKANVFVSYSRRNKQFVERLHAALEATRRQVWVDWENIPLASDWWREIELGIELADTFIFVLSPDSVQSKVCRQEIDHAVKHNKRLVPLVYEDVAPSQVHPELARLNWIFLRQDDDFEANFPGLLTALDQNIDYVRTHTRLLVKALEWDRHDRDGSYLLRGAELERANDYLVQGRQEEPRPTPLHHQYVLTSAEVEANQQKAEITRQSSLLQLQRRGLEVVTAISVLALALGLSSLGLYRQTLQARRAADHSHLKALSQSATALFLSDQSFEALVTATQAGSLLQAHETEVEADASLRSEIAKALQQALFWVYERNRLNGHTGTVWQVQFIDQGQGLISASADGTLRIWQADGTLLTTLSGNGAPLQDVALSPDQETIAAVDSEGFLYLWQQDGTVIDRWSAHDQPIRALAFSPDGETLATAGEDAMIKLWQWRSGDLRRSLTSDRGGIQDLLFSPDGQTVVSGDEGGWLQRWSINGQLEDAAPAHRGPILGLALDPASQTVAVASHDRSVSLWSIAATTLRERRRFQAHDEPINSVQFTPDGTYLITGGSDRAIYVWTREGDLHHTLLGHTGQVTTIAPHPDGQRFATAGSDRTIRLWTIRRPHLQILRGHRAGVNRVAASPTAAELASVSDDGTVKLWQYDGTLLRTLSDHAEAVLDVAFSGDGSQLASASVDGSVRLWQRDGRLLEVLTGHQGPVHGVAFSPSGDLIASAGGDHTVKLWRPDGTLWKTLQGHDDGLLNVAFNPEGTLLASVGWDHDVRLWSAEGELIRTLTGHRGAIFAAQFSPDGTLLATASEDSTVKLWQVEDGSLLSTLAGHQDSVLAVTFTPDGQKIVSVGIDQTLRFWDLDSTLLNTLSGHDHALNDVVFSADGEYVVSASGDRTVLVWQLAIIGDLSQLLTRSCDWLTDYLRTNPLVEPETRQMCAVTSAPTDGALSTPGVGP